MDRRFWPAVVLVAPFHAIVLFILAAFLIALVREADAHDAPQSFARPQGWSYPFSCCSGVDCRPVSASRIREGGDGYTVPSGEIVPLGDPRLKDSPDGEFHWCSVAGADDGRTICLFVPPRAM